MYQLVTPELPPPVNSELFRDQLAEAGQLMAKAGVKEIILAHGTFVGDDILGVLGEVERFFPNATQSWRGSTNPWRTPSWGISPIMNRDMPTCFRRG